MINEQIRDKEVRVLGENGELVGIMSPKDALKIAKEQGVDLVKFVPNANPPVCKLVNYSKFKYEQAKREKEAKKKQKVVEIKEVRIATLFQRGFFLRYLASCFSPPTCMAIYTPGVSIPSQFSPSAILYIDFPDRNSLKIRFTI